MKTYLTASIIDRIDKFLAQYEEADNKSDYLDDAITLLEDISFELGHD